MFTSNCTKLFSGWFYVQYHLKPYSITDDMMCSSDAIVKTLIWIPVLIMTLMYGINRSIDIPDADGDHHASIQKSLHAGKPELYWQINFQGFLARITLNWT